MLCNYFKIIILYVLSLTSRFSPGRTKIPQGIIGELHDPIRHERKPGPGQYDPHDQMKQPPAYSLQPPVKPFKEPWDMWTPGPNMYWPPIPAK